MSAQPAVGLVTAETLLELPDDGHRYELVGGKLRVVSPAGFEHGDVALEIGARLKEYVRARRLGRAVGAETGFRLFVWLAAGTALVWVVYPGQRLVAVYLPDGSVRHRREGDEVDGGDVLPGFRLPVADIFA